MRNLIFLTVLLVYTTSIQIPLHEEPRCMIITATFQPIKVEIKFPSIPNKIQGEKFNVALIDYLQQSLIEETHVDDNYVFRKNYKLQTDKLYYVCMEVVRVRNKFKENEQIYADYTATEDFQSLIGKIQVPAELSKQQNLKSIYTLAKELTNLNKKIEENQQKQRQLEDKLVGENVHKNQRIISLTLIECLVIILSGVYQIFALRRFLIDKNLY